MAQLLLAVAIVACWATVAGDRRWLVWLIAAGSVAIQAHIAFLPPVGALVVLAGVSLIRRTPVFSKRSVDIDVDEA